jgi:hypothetical protein
MNASMLTLIDMPMTLQTGSGGNSLVVLFLQVFALGVLGWLVRRGYQRHGPAERPAPETPLTHVCRNCGSRVQPIEGTRLNSCFLIALLMCFLIPGILYWIWAGTQYVQICPKCSAQNTLVPSDSPEGQRLAPDQQSSSTPDGRLERPCPWCAEPILPAAKVCKHCGRDVEPVAYPEWDADEVAGLQMATSLPESTDASHPPNQLARGDAAKCVTCGTLLTNITAHELNGLYYCSRHYVRAL